MDFSGWAKALWPLIFFTAACNGAGDDHGRVMLGSEVLIRQHLDRLSGKRVGLITNQTGELPEGGSLAEALVKHGVALVALFSPEHGSRGTEKAGEAVSDTSDPLTGIRVFSLYGATRKPTSEMLRGIDILLYDLQDVGVRCYTYISTMGLAMEAASEAGIPFLVLDRPDPLGGLRVEGPVMEDSLRSFVGRYPIPFVYGLTCGELALMLAGEGWLETATMPRVDVIRMEGWRRRMLWDDTGLAWIPPSPNIPDAATALIYPATCFVEATAVSEGRGTPAPFKTIGAPFVDGELLSRSLASTGNSGIAIEPVSFTPGSSKHSGHLCRGIRVSVSSEVGYHAVPFGIHLLMILRDLYPSETDINRGSLGRLLGSAEAVRLIVSGGDPSRFEALCSTGVDSFIALSRPYRLYE